MSVECDRYVMLAGGLAVPVEPVRFALSLEARGFRLSRDDGDILVQPASKLTADDWRYLKLWKPHILALLDYLPPEAA